MLWYFRDSADRSKKIFLFPTPEDLVRHEERPSEQRQGKNKNKIIVYEVSCFIIDQLVGACFLQYRDIVEVNPERKMGEWRFSLMMERKAFNAIPV